MRSFTAALLVSVGCALSLVPYEALAQDLEVRAAQKPYYAGIPIELELVARGFEEEARPEIAAETSAGSTIEVVGVTPKVSTFMEVMNGRVKRSKKVEYVYRLRFEAPQPGRYRIGPFRVTQGDLERQTGTFEVTLGTIPVTGNQRIRLVLPDGPVYVGQRVPVKLEWWTQLDVADRLVSQRAIVPFFDRIGAFTFVDGADARAKFDLKVDLKTGRVQFPATAHNETDGAHQFIVRSAERTMIPLEAGTFTIDPATLIVDEAVAWRRDFFGMRTPTQTRAVRAVDRERVLTVSRLPAQGRPPSFAGAVGSGFSLQARADRTVVRAGDPITLTLTLRGDGGLETAALPVLTDAGLDADRFRVPHEILSGKYEDGVKSFEAGVRVLDASVREIPPIAYSWFDPAKGGYQTAQSEPIALSVSAAKVVSAADVFSGSEDADSSDGRRSADERSSAGDEFDSSPQNGAGAEDGRETLGKVGLVLTGADLSVETDPERMSARGAGWLSSKPVQAMMYATGLLALGFAGMVRRRADEDPAVRRRRVEIAELRSRLDRADGAEEVAEVLRKLRLFADDEGQAGLDGLVRELEEVVYRPDGGSAHISSELKTRAREVAARVAVCVFFLWSLLQFASPHAALADKGAGLAPPSLNRVAAEALAAYAQAQNESERRVRLAGFTRAHALFSSAIALAERPGADLYANQGNAALQAERLGDAILAFRRALSIDPSHRRAQQNLVYARGLLPSWVPRPQDAGMIDSFLSWPSRIPEAELLGIVAVSFVLMCLLAAIGIGRSTNGFLAAAALPAVVWGLLVLSPVLGFSDGAGVDAVVVVDGALGRASDSAHAPVRFREPLPAGAEVTIAERRPGWVRAVLSSGRDAWLSEGSVESVQG